MGNFDENLNLGKRVLPPLYQNQSFKLGPVLFIEYTVPTEEAE